MQELSQLQAIFERTKDGIGTFMSMLQPVIDNATDEHTKLYYHHILEEEEQRLDRLNALIPTLKSLVEDGKVDELSNRELSYLLSDLNLERFGLHNFREHLELSLYEFQDEERKNALNSMREATQNDYLAIKEIMQNLGDRFKEADVTINITDHDEGHEVHQVNHFQASSAAAPANATTAATAAPVAKKGLTVGSLRNL